MTLWGLVGFLSEINSFGFAKSNKGTLS